MTQEQKALFNKMTKLQKAMALNDLKGMKPAENHKASGGVCNNEPNRGKLASEILNNPDVVAFIDAMKPAAINEAVMTRQRMMEIQTKIAESIASDKTKIGLESVTEYKAAFEVQLKAMKQLAELAGYDAPTKSEVKNVTDTGENEW